MNSPDTLQSLSPIALLKREIERLTEEHTAALKRATFVGMTAEEAKASDERRRKISELMQQLTLLQQSVAPEPPLSLKHS